MLVGLIMFDYTLSPALYSQALNGADESRKGPSIPLASRNIAAHRL